MGGGTWTSKFWPMLWRFFIFKYLFKTNTRHTTTNPTPNGFNPTIYIFNSIYMSITLLYTIQRTEDPSSESHGRICHSFHFVFALFFQTFVHISLFLYVILVDIFIWCYLFMILTTVQFTCVYTYMFHIFLFTTDTDLYFLFFRKIERNINHSIF